MGVVVVAAQVEGDSVVMAAVVVMGVVVLVSVLGFAFLGGYVSRGTRQCGKQSWAPLHEQEGAGGIDCDGFSV
jgi:hypothetical protein